VRTRGKLAAAIAVTAALLPAAAGCGDEDEDGEDAGSAAPAAFTLTQPTRAGSFFGAGPDYELILRGVGGAASIGAEGSAPGGSAGAIAASALARDPEALLGPPPWPATLAGAEVLPQAFELELTAPEYDGTRLQLSFDATPTAGLPERPPSSFGAATLTISSTLPSGSLTGTVTSAGSSTEPTGTPLGGALVEVRLGGRGLATALTEPDGSFEVGPLPDAEYELVASLPAYERDRVPSTIGTGSDLVLIPVGGAPTVPPEEGSGSGISE
jgi:hypothetical protein